MPLPVRVAAEIKSTSGKDKRHKNKMHLQRSFAKYQQINFSLFFLFFFFNINQLGTWVSTSAFQGFSTWECYINWSDDAI